MIIKITLILKIKKNKKELHVKEKDNKLLVIMMK